MTLCLILRLFASFVSVCVCDLDNFSVHVQTGLGPQGPPLLRSESEIYLIYGNDKSAKSGRITVSYSCFRNSPRHIIYFSETQ